MSANQLPPGSNGLPILGETLSFVFDANYIAKRYQQYGAIFRTNLIGKPTVVMVGPEAAEFVLSSHMEHFSWRQGWPNNFKELLGESLFLMDGEEHRQKRRLIMPAMHGPALTDYFATMEQITQNYLNKWVTKHEFTWFEEFKQLTFDVASELLLGTKTGTDSIRLSQLFTTLTDGLITINPLKLPFTQYGKAIAARNQILEHLTTVVRQRRENPTKDALSLLIQAKDEDGNSLTEQELVAQSVLLLFAGHETTTSMLTWLCIELARHPEVKQRARSEQLQLAKQGELNLEQLGQMPYLEQVLSEVERLYPPVGGGFRGVVKDFEFKGYHIPAGWQVLYSILQTHRIQEIYPEPERFDPERFNPQRKENKRPFSLIGFGGGPRVCIGIAFAKMEMKIIAAHLLRNYDWEILPNQSLEVVRVPTTRPKDGFKVRFGANT
ncbi:cytochrome P450 [Dulcicalothrix desertica PCC 7102]|uniref:Cytochrome P450 n=1 Tax=Dulcicalothrix desertica PCC 7102 TaxID=232991 RepID=A0A3S1CQS5_9CYAN|nr:cytochrome P450 [Dulcicalothrix desertica]RUT06676.1 cytochrome P450 [Dulcicalothrix desertica PCC 7102]TWH50212.1 cytochrome P450 [Dulcicalothrix desertica PCC 7102]